MQTTRIDLTDTWVKIVGAGIEFTVQNVSGGKVEVAFADSGAPIADPDKFAGIVLENFKGISSVTFGQGELYARSFAAKAAVMVSF